MTDHSAIGRRRALAFRIWVLATSEEWNITCGEIADRLGEPLGRVANAMRYTGWHTRIRHDYCHALTGPLRYCLIKGFDGPDRLEHGDMDGVA